MSSAQGRFTSPDPLVWQSWQSGNDDEKARFAEFISDPQNFNLYTYGRNNPLKYNDPTGLDVELAISFVGDVSDEEKKRIMGAVRSYLEGLKVGKVVVRDAADSSQDKRTFGQKVKDLFTVDYHSIAVDLAHPNPFGNNADKPDFVKAFNMVRTGDPGDYFGDLRQSDPTQWSNIIAWRVLHESVSHAFGIGPDNDQLVQVGGPRAGTLIQGSYGRGKPGIPPLNPSDTRAIHNGCWCLGAVAMVSRFLRRADAVLAAMHALLWTVVMIVWFFAWRVEPAPMGPPFNFAKRFISRIDILVSGPLDSLSVSLALKMSKWFHTDLGLTFAVLFGCLILLAGTLQWLLLGR